ncbi:MAG: DUF3089 domain-containing protein [Eubacterium sp.]|nr:DUF3089 domain-containing protein [Eubacterium sp.]
MNRIKKAASIIIAVALVTSFSALMQLPSETSRAVDNAGNLCLAETTSGVPDYSDESNWAYYGIGEGKSSDVFLICPTVDTQAEYNMSMDDEKTKAHFLGALNMERGIYEDSATLYSPYYRQISMKAYALSEKERAEYFETAYSDVSAAFRYYLENKNNDRPIILAGFSQGAHMCYRLLEEYFSDTALRDRLVAVYALGWYCDQDTLKKYPQIVPATGEDDTGVVVSFDCEAPEVTGTFTCPSDVKSICINPLNWKTDGTPAPASENIGACFPDYEGNIKLETPGLCGCYIDETRGVLKVTDVSPTDYPAMIDLFPEGAYHIYDYQFFYRNLQKNVSVRLDAYLKKADETGEKESLMSLYSDKPAATKVDISGRTKKELKSMFYIKKIDDATWESMQGKSYHKGCPVKRSGLRRVRILYYSYNKKTYIGELITNKAIGQDVRDIFKKLYMKKYQIKRVVPIDEYDGDDTRSMKKDNTSCFNYRTVAGTNTISKHGYGMAIDINPVENPYVVGDYVSPRNGREYADRTKDFAHKIDKNDLCYKLFHKAGFFWGGDWNYTKDYQHFQKTQ